MAEEQVRHPQYGVGTVCGSRHGGFELSVRFEDGTRRWVRCDEIQRSVLGSDHPPRSSPRQTQSEVFRARRIIEALRLGIVPHDSVEEFTFGREQEIRTIMDWLNSPSSHPLIVVGEYGCGKTHLLDYIYWRALGEGFAVAKAEIDPNEIPFHKPKRVYAALAHSLRFELSGSAQTGSFRDFMEEALRRGAFRDHAYFRHLVNRTSDESLWEWIEAKELAGRPLGHSFVPALYDYGRAANVYCYLLTALGWASVSVLGLKGVLLIFDEAELIDLNLGSRHQTALAWNFLKALCRAALNEPDLTKPPHEVDQLIYSERAKDVPFVYRHPSGLKLLFAFTETLEGRDETVLAVRSLAPHALEQLFRTIAAVYCKAYSLCEPQLVTDTFPRKLLMRRALPRYFVKAAVEALDLVRFGRDPAAVFKELR